MKSFFSILFGLSFLAFQVNAQQCFVDCLPTQVEHSQMDAEADHSCCEGVASHDEEEQKNSHHCNETHCLSALTSTYKAFALSSSSQDDFPEVLIPQDLSWNFVSNLAQSHPLDLEFLSHSTSKLGLYIVLKRLRVS